MQRLLGGGARAAPPSRQVVGPGARVMLSNVASLVDHGGRWYLLAETLLLLDGVGTSHSHFLQSCSVGVGSCSVDLGSRKEASLVVD